MTFNDIYIEYLDYLNLKLKPTTITFMKYKYDNYMLPYIGNYNIFNFNLNDYVNWWNQLQSLNKSKVFYDRVYTCVNSYFKYLNLNYDIKNYASLVGHEHSTNRQVKELKTFTLKEYKKFIRVVDDNIYHAFFNTLFYTGIRKGEAMALKWNDFKGDYLYINKTLTKELYNGKHLELSTKTKKSTRKIRIDSKLKYELNNLHKYYIKKYKNFNNNFFIFGGDKSLSCSSILRHKNKYCDKANLNRIRIHDFRHSHATILYDHGVDIKLIQERLGHEDISTTLNTYVHTTNEQEKKLINTINFLRL